MLLVKSISRQLSKGFAGTPVIAAVLVAAIGSLSSCANLQTVGRTTPIDDGTAIHLDAQQRLVVASAEGYCAEPSPDALSAYVASLGFSTPGSQTRDGASFLEALKSTTGSIGLRTQSITLMRDALYRMCEASNNGHLNDLEVAAFLRRSQDLTAVVLAIEQLTGAVAADQIALTPDSAATKAEELVSNHQALDQAELIWRTHEEAVAEAQRQFLELNAVRDEAAATREALQKEYTQNHAAQEGTPDAINQKAAIARADQALQQANEEVAQAQRELDYRLHRLNDAEEVVNRLREIRDASLAAPASDVQPGYTPVRSERRADLTAEQTESIARAITKMVELVVHKNDVLDLCMSHMLSTQNVNQISNDAGFPKVNAPDSSVETVRDDQGEKPSLILCRLIIRRHLDQFRQETQKGR